MEWGKALNESLGYCNYGMGKGLNESPGYYRMGKGLNESPGYYRMGKGLNESPGYYRMGKGLNESTGYYRMGKGLNESPGYYRKGKGLNESPGYYRMGKGLNESPGYYRMGKGLNESPGYYRKNTNMYTAVNVEMVTGQPMSGKDLPSLPIQFSYRLETVIPQSGRVTETFIWYDGVADIVRYDARDPYGDNPYMMSYIQDFQKGISFEINQVTGSCKITALGQGAFDVVTSKPSSDGSQVVSLKSPQSLFYLSDSYRFIGQTDWDYVSPDGTDLTHSKPVMLEVEDTTTGTYFTVNFYDFDDQYHPASYFDTSPCYDIDQKLDFIIIFKGQPYHPNLDQAYNSFINSAVQLMATQTRLSPMQFQQVSLRYDDNDDIYLFVTALGNVPPFVLTVGLNSSITPISADTVEDCAAACVSTNSFICNSFDWCGDSGCLLGQKHAESEGDPSATPENNPCTHYTRTENGTFPTVDVSTLYKIILDYVYNDMFKLTVTLQDNSTKTYIATDIRDDLEIPTDPSDTSGSLLRNYVVTPNSKFLDNIINITNDMVSVTDCALSCSQENTFSCQSYDYSFTTGECRLTSVHPDEFNSSQPAIINASMFTNIYSKMYTMEYTRNSAEVFTTVADKRLTNINSDEMCARACTINSDFRCESFEICDDGSCNLRKTHIIQAKSSDLTNASGCTHYSRNHLYDFVERDYKTLSSVPNSKSVGYSSALSCANVCSLGELVPSCASFTTCGTDREISWCTLTTADPTVSTNVTIVSDEHCTLYTRANNVPVINPSAHAVTVQPTRPTTTSTSTTVKTQASSAIIKNPTVLSTSTYQNTGANNYANQCSPNKESTSDTGTRVGIAFGTLFLGLIVGGVASFLFMKFRYRGRNSEDSQMLKTWGN
ncbi:hypothetical protein Btru_036399 [Bulinus truncatus]|nr:hypothetical protein Btru_036399 [Bulinus truncatus]